MGVFSALEDLNTEELFRIVTECDNRAEKRVQNQLPKNAPDYRWWVVREGAAMFRRKLQLLEPSVLVPRKLLPDHVQALLGDILQPQPKAAPIRKQMPHPYLRQHQDPELQQYRPVNLGRIQWLDELPAPPPMQQAEVVPAEELGNALLNYHEEVVANMARVVPIAEDEIYPDPF